MEGLGGGGLGANVKQDSILACCVLFYFQLSNVVVLSLFVMTDM